MGQKYTWMIAALVLAQTLATAETSVNMDSTRQSNVAAYAMSNGAALYNSGQAQHGLEWPRGSGHYFTFGAGIWAGARVEVDDRSDSVVFMTYNPNSGQSWGTPLTDVTYTSESGIEKLRWSLDDSSLDRYEGSPIKRADEGYPLGLQIDQELVGWTFGPYANSVVITTTVTNTSDSRPLYDFILGWAMDLDVGRRGSPSNIGIHDRLGIIRSVGTPIMRVHDALDHDLGTMGMTFIESSGGARLVTCSVWPSAMDSQGPDRYAYLAGGSLDTITAMPDSDIRAILAAAPIDLQPGESTSIVLLLTFDQEVSDEADQRITELVDGFSFTTSVDDIDVDARASVTVFPNPTHGSHEVHVAHQAADTKITVVDLLGRERIAATTAPSLDITSLEHGLYFVLVETDGHIERLKLMVNR